MTSQHYSEKTEKTDSGVRRTTNRRGIKKRGILPSFGDIVLPIVSIAAVILLILAARQFFVNGINTSPGISSTRAYAEAPALIAEREKKQEEENIAIAENKPAPVVSVDVAEVTATPEKTEFLATAEIVSPPKPKTEPAKTATATTAKAAPAKTTTQKAATTKAAPAKTTAAKTTTAKAPAANTKLTVSTISKQWRIQVGAYGSKAAAQVEVNKITKAGYQALVYSNPASKHYKVWVAGGNDKSSATNVENAMKKLGYKGSFSFPPSK